MWGNPSHLAELMRVVQEKKEPNDEGVILHAISAETNRDGSTYDGIDWGGERVAEEVNIVNLTCTCTEVDPRSLQNSTSWNANRRK